MNILMLAAENGALPGGKVGGMGDVIRDIPPALASLGHQVTVLTPAYATFCHLPGTSLSAGVTARFRGEPVSLELFDLTDDPGRPGVRQRVLEHPLFSACGAGAIYCDDPPDRPFATDASKFALFCAAAAAALLDGQLPRPDVIHLHDWHSAVLAVLLRCDPAFLPLADIPLVFTIHNLALQGIRPLEGDESSLKSWFPELAITRESLRDPRYADCFNPMRAAIALCGKVHAVSPTYAREICDPQNDSGSGLQADLQKAHAEGRLLGILNGCEYPQPAPAPGEFGDFMRTARDELTRWLGKSTAVSGADLLALRALDRWIDEGRSRPSLLVSSVGRLTTQKLGLLTQRLDDGRSCLEHLLDVLGDDDLLIVLGNGDRQLESFLGECASRRANILFLRGYSETLSEQLYASGDLFLMPSNFEPCGISQMLAMRSGQPCLVNQVGGLADTVEDGITGYVFRGASDKDRAQALLRRWREALDLLRHSPDKTRSMRKAAASKRFMWKTAAQAYVKNLYCADTAVKGARATAGK